MKTKKEKKTDGFFVFEDISVNSTMTAEQHMAALEEADSQRSIEMQLARIEKKLRKMIAESEPKPSQIRKNKKLQEYYEKFEGKNPVKDYAEFALRCMNQVKRHLKDGNEGKFTALSTVSMMDAYWMARIHVPEIKGNVVEKIIIGKAQSKSAEKTNKVKKSEAASIREKIREHGLPLLAKGRNYSEASRILQDKYKVARTARRISTILKELEQED